MKVFRAENKSLTGSRTKTTQALKKIRYSNLRVETDQAKNGNSQIEKSVTASRKQNSSSQARYKTPSSNSFQKRSISCIKKTNQSASFHPRNNVRCLSTSFNKLSQSSQKNQVYKYHNPWGGPPIAKAYAKEQFIENEKKSLVLLNNLKQEMENKSLFMPSNIKYKSKKLYSHQSRVKLKVRSLPEYARFINCDCSYNVGFDFGYLRGLSKSEIQNVVDMSYFKVVESIMLCVLDVLRGETKSDEKGSYKLLKQYSLFYFGLFQKVLTQFVIYYHYFKLIHLKITNFFVQTRLYFIILNQTASNQPQIIKKHKGKFQAVLNLILCIKRQLLPNQKISSQQSSVAQTFKILKSISIIEKKISQLHISMQELVTLVIHQPRIKTVNKQLQIFDKIQCLSGLELQFLAQTECIIGWNFYQLPPLPYLPPKKSQKSYTLVVTLTDTLVYYSKQQQTIIYRPFTTIFLQKITQMFQLIIWSDQKKHYSDPIIDFIEKTNKIFEFRLYSQHFSLKDGVLGLDLSRIGRQTQKTFLLRSCQNQKTNFIQSFQRGHLQVQAYKGDVTDKQLLDLLIALEEMNNNQATNPLTDQLSKKRPLSRVQEEMEENHTISTHKQV